MNFGYFLSITPAIWVQSQKNTCSNEIGGLFFEVDFTSDNDELIVHAYIYFPVYNILMRSVASFFFFWSGLHFWQQRTGTFHRTDSRSELGREKPGKSAGSPAGCFNSDCRSNCQICPIDKCEKYLRFRSDPVVILDMDKVRLCCHRSKLASVLTSASLLNQEKNRK